MSITWIIPSCLVASLQVSYHHWHWTLKWCIHLQGACSSSYWPMLWDNLRGWEEVWIRTKNHRNQMHQISRCHLVHVVLNWWCCWLSVKPSSSHHQVTETHIHSIKTRTLVGFLLCVVNKLLNLLNWIPNNAIKNTEKCQQDLDPIKTALWPIFGSLPTSWETQIFEV